MLIEALALRLRWVFLFRPIPRPPCLPELPFSLFNGQKYSLRSLEFCVFLLWNEGVRSILLDNKCIGEFLSSNILILKTLLFQALMPIAFLAYKLITTFLLIYDIGYKIFLNHYRSEDDKPSETYF